MAFVPEDLDWSAGTDNTAGIQQNVYLVPFEDVETHPTFPKLGDVAVTNFAELATVSTNLVLKTGKKPIKVYCTLEAGAGNSELQGELDGKSFMNTLKFLHPGNKAAASGFARWAKNGSFYLIYADLDGAELLLGHPGYPAKMQSAPGGTGEKSSDRKARTFTFQSVWSGPTPHFTGKVLAGAEEQVLVFIE